MPVDYADRQRGADGSATVWVGEIELRHRMKWLVGLTLRPGSLGRRGDDRRSSTARPSPTPCSASPTSPIHANPDYQVIFPPRHDARHLPRQEPVHPLAGLDRDLQRPGLHARASTSAGGRTTSRRPRSSPSTPRAISWPATTTARTPASCFVADHNFVPGKKLWTWGTGTEGATLGKDPDRRRRPLRSSSWSARVPTTSPTTAGSSPTRPGRSPSSGTPSADWAGSRTRTARPPAT